LPAASFEEHVTPTVLVPDAVSVNARKKVVPAGKDTDEVVPVPVVQVDVQVMVGVAPELSLDVMVGNVTLTLFCWLGTDTEGLGPVIEKTGAVVSAGGENARVGKKV
jgi:hypothetical protein